MVHSQISPVPDTVSSAITNDEARRADGIEVQRQQALLKTGALQNAIFASANYSITVTDENGIIQLFDVGAELMLGYLAEEVVNKINPSDIHAPKEVMARAKALTDELGTPITPGFEALACKASRGVDDIYQLTYICRDGRRFPAIVSITALRDDFGDIIGYLLIGTDNPVRKEVEVALKEAMSVAEKANLAKSDFLSNVSHELRTPLSAILGFAQRVESGTPQPMSAQKRSIDQILQAGWYLLNLINEILDLAPIKSGKLSLSLEPVGLTEVMLECQTMIESQAQKRGITVTFEPLAFPYFVMVDRRRVNQVLINVLSNAIKHNSVGGTARVRCAGITAGRICISVEDTGAGLTAEKITQLFQPFNRLGQETSEQGTGIGLLITKRLIELMGGEIRVESVVDKGSIFSIDMNMKVERQGLVGALGEYVHAEQLGAVSAANVRTVRYLQDNPANLMLVEDLIARRADIRPLTARDGMSGI